jgi:hypothetical protein
MRFGGNSVLPVFMTSCLWSAMGAVLNEIPTPDRPVPAVLVEPPGRP